MATTGPPSRNEANSTPESDSSSSSPSALGDSPTTHPNPVPSPIAGMTKSSTPLGPINAARRPGPPQPTLSGRGGALPQGLEAKVRAFHLSRQGAPPNGGALHGQSITPKQGPQSPTVGPGGVPGNFQLPSGASRPGIPGTTSTPRFPGTSGGGLSLAEKRGMKFSGSLSGGLTGGVGGPSQQTPSGRRKPTMRLGDMNGGANSGQTGEGGNISASGNKPRSRLDEYNKFIDVETGSLTFTNKAKLTAQGVEFTSGKTYSISLDEVDTIDELGKGNYGTVWKVRHARPRMRRPGLGLAGNKSLSTASSAGSDYTPEEKDKGATSGAIMAMKELRLELEDAKFAAIIMELDILHRCVSPFIVDFYGAFFQEGAVYICMEWMDGGSIDKLYAETVPESVLRKIALSTTMGLKSLKDEHNIIHRDVKPTNILVNTKGQVKICDFGVSGNLVASIAKTNIGCQSYMAPERISSGGVAQAGAAASGTYSVQSDIWSLGLTIIECALGRYPYPPETYDNIFSQLSAIVDGEPPDLPADRFSEAARDFVRGCLMKIPKLRPTYAMLLQHAWLAPLLKPPTISEEDEEAAEKGEIFNSGDAGRDDLSHATEDAEVANWVKKALERRRNGAAGAKPQAPALHTAPLDSVQSPVAAS